MNKTKLPKSKFKGVAKSTVAKTKKKLPKADTKKIKDSSKALKAYTYTGRGHARNELHSKQKAQYLATLPKSRTKRILYRLHPKRFFKFWFSKRGILFGLKLTFIGAIIGFITVASVFAYYRIEVSQLSDPNSLASRQVNQTTRFYDRTGETQLFEVYGDERRTVVDFKNINEDLVNATVAVEDEDFYEHNGYSITGIARAFRNNVTGTGGTQGGSTITQQFVKNSLLTNEQTYTRKIKELILAIEIERKFTKDEILEFYLNEISYGGISYGIEAASQTYFDKPASELTLDESAILAALPQAPGDFSPYGSNTDALVSRQKVVLEKMLQQNYITQEEYDKAIKVKTLSKVVPLEDQGAYSEVIAPHFVEKTKDILIEEYGRDLVESGGLQVITTLDLELQEAAENAVVNNINAVDVNNGDNAALSSTDVETGQVLAQVGSRDFFYPEYGAVNAASPENGRQPGSSFKPFGYAQLFQSDRWGPGSVIYDTKTNFSGSYAPNNFDKLFPGAMTVRDALGRSRNIPAVKALYIAGVEETVDLARAAGNEFLCDDCAYGLSLVLGSGEVKLDEHTHAYSTLARGGTYVPQTYVLSVKNSQGQVLQEYEKQPGEQVIDEEIAYLVSDVLSDDKARRATFGANNGNLVVPGLNHTVKTGSTDRSVDGWMMGYTTCTAIGVWAGNHDGRPMDSITSRQTGPIFTDFMRSSHAIRGCGTDAFERPEGIQEVKIDTATGREATQFSRTTHTDLFPSWYSPPAQGSTKLITIDSVTNKLATNCTPDSSKIQVLESGVLPELPESDPEFNNWAISAPYGRGGFATSAQDDLHKCSDKKPKVNNLSATQSGSNARRYQIAVSVTKGTHGLGTLIFYSNGNEINRSSISGSGAFSYTHTFGSNGSKNITVEVIDNARYTDAAATSVNVGSSTTPAPTPTSAPTSTPTPTSTATPTPPPSSTPVSFILSTPTGSSVANPAAFTWNSVTGATQYDICLDQDGTGVNCISISAPTTAYSTSLASGSTYDVYAVAYGSGGAILATTSTATFTMQ